MRKHGWQLPYHPLQVVAIAVFLALGFAFYVFFVPFVGNKMFEFVVVGLYTPLVTCVFCLYIWCAATDPGDPGVFKSKKYIHIKDSHKKAHTEVAKGGSISESYAVVIGDKEVNEGMNTNAVGEKLPNRFERESSSCCNIPILVVLFGWCPLPFLTSLWSSHTQSSEQQTSEDGMFYCSLCEVEVLKYSKHCRVCDKCVDNFDHHCRWLNNCIGRKNYRGFFILMVSALLLLILQWSIGVVVMILCFLERKRFSTEIITKLGSSFTMAPFIVVVASSTFLAMVATLPLAQLFFFHVLLIKKGISTYDYIIALREQDQQNVGQQSPQVSSASSITGLSSTSSFGVFHRGAWCTPPRLFLEDQFDVIPPETSMSTQAAGKRMMTMPEESSRKRNAGNVKISPWALARLNADEVSKAAAQARKNSRILRPVIGGGRADNRKRANKRGRFPSELPLEPLAKISTDTTTGSLAPLQLEARSAFMPTRPVPLSSPDSSLGSPDLHTFRVSSSGAEETHGISSLPSIGFPSNQLSRSTSDGYDASGGEDSDRVPSRIVHRSSNWGSLLFGSGRADMADEPPKSSSSLALPSRQR